MPANAAVPVPSEIKLALLVLSLGLDTLAVAIALGISGLGRRGRLRIGAIFSLFEGGMPLIGFAVGRVFSGALGEIASILGIVVLLGVGTWMVYESLAADDDLGVRVDDWRGLLLTSFSVSLDELAIGFSMGALRLPIGLTAGLIATQAFVLTLTGTAIGNRVGQKLAERAERVAGIILCGLALLLLAEKIGGR